MPAASPCGFAVTVNDAGETANAVPLAGATVSQPEPESTAAVAEKVRAPPPRLETTTCFDAAVAPTDVGAPHPSHVAASETRPRPQAQQSAQSQATARGGLCGCHGEQLVHLGGRVGRLGPVAGQDDGLGFHLARRHTPGHEAQGCQPQPGGARAGGS